MRRPRWEMELESRFDSGDASADAVRCDPEAARHLDALQRIRDGVRETPRPTGIADEQMPAFLRGIHDRLEERPRGVSRLWPAFSLAAAAVVVVASLLVLLPGDAPQAEATVVEEATSDIEGATVTWFATGEGDAAVWIEVADEDLW